MKTGILLGRALMLFITLTLLVSCKNDDEDITILLDEAALNLQVGETAQLTATVTPSNRTVSWISSNPEVATVDDNGLVTAVMDGTATITARTGNQTATCLVTVAEILISLDKTEVSMWVGETSQLTATVDPEGIDVTWESSNTAIATVDENGLVTGVAQGTAIISAIAGNSKAECEFTITIPQITIWTLGNENRGSGTPSAQVIRVYKDDQLFIELTDATANSLGEGLFVDDTKVYVVGYVGRVAKLWTVDIETKAKIETDLTDGTYFALPKGVLVSGGKVYVAGFERTPAASYERPRLWIDGVVQPEPASEANLAPVYTVFVDGNDVYLGGRDGVNAVIWKNSNRELVQAGTTSISTQINKLTVSNGSVYAVGTYSANYPVIWKDKVMSPLPTLNNHGTPWDVAVDGNDVYVVGQEAVSTSPLITNGGVVWKNGEKLYSLWEQVASRAAIARGIAISDGDVYVAGHEAVEYTVGESIVARSAVKVWKNGQLLWQLSNSTQYNSTGYAIAITKK